MDGLDSAGVRELLMPLSARGRTIQLASHHLLAAEGPCDAVCGMDGGALTRVGLPQVESTYAPYVRIM